MLSVSTMKTAKNAIATLSGVPRDVAGAACATQGVETLQHVRHDQERIGLAAAVGDAADEGGGEEGSDLQLLHQPLLRLALSLRNNPSARQKRRSPPSACKEWE